MKDFNKDITVVFDGYKPSSKDHDHKRRNKSFSSNIVHNQNTKARFIANSHNKIQAILLLSDVLGRNGVEVFLAEDDDDTLIVKTALRYALARDVEVRVEDTDFVSLMIHHCLKTNYSFFVSTKAGTYDIKSIRANLPPKQTEHLL